MAPQFNKLAYKPNTQSSEEFVMIVDGETYEKWKDGDTPMDGYLADSCVTAYTVFHSIQGNQGKLGQASKQQLENTFGTSREDDVAQFMLENGTLLGKTDMQGRLMDKSRYGQQLDTRGSGSGLHGV